MTTNVYKTYVFDFDGTLVDSMPSYIGVMLRILDEEGVRHPDTIVKTITPLGYGGTADYYRDTLGISLPREELIARMSAYATEAYEKKIVLKEGVLETLHALKERGASLNVLTASPHSMLDVCLRRVGVYDIFDNVWSCEDFATTKANPDIYRQVAEKLDTGVGDYIFVDDNIDAVRTARSAGVHTFGIYDASGEEFVDEMRSVAHRYLMRFSDLLSISPVPMKFRADLHIHSELSSCSADPEQTPTTILEYAKKHSLDTVCLTDHYWDRTVSGASSWYQPQDYEHISQALPLPKNERVSFLFGCETDMDKCTRIGIPPERYDDFDFIIIPTTHMHMQGFTLENEDYQNNERLALLWVERLDALLSMSLPYHKVGIAHLACGLINRKSREDFIDTINRIPTKEMERVFARASALGVGIELNGSDMSFADDERDAVLRMFRVARDMGCKFYFGTDAHHPKNFKRAKETFERAIVLLDLCENDAFMLF